MSYTDLRDFSPELIFPIGPFGKGIPTLTLEIEKMGGGTLGKSYDGRWRYQIRVDDVVTEYGQNFDSASKLSHLDAGREIGAWLSRGYAEAFSESAIARRLQEWLSQFDTED